MSLKKIASIVGVSPSTVSRVLNNPDYHCKSEKLETAIWNIARELNYIPNEAARNLKLGTYEQIKAYKIDLLLTRFNTLEIDPFFNELFTSIEHELHKQNCLLANILYLQHFVKQSQSAKTSIYKESEPAIYNSTIQTDSNGIIILGKCPEKFLTILKKQYHYLIGVDRNPTDFQIDEIICDGKQAAIIAMEYLISLGHKKIAYVGDCNNESRYMGYHEALVLHKIPVSHANIYPTNQTQSEGFSIMEKIVQQKNRPTAVFCANDITAIGILKFLNSNKKYKYLPSIISIDNILASQSTNPLLTTVNIPKNDMGKLAVNILLDQIKGNHSEKIRLELPCKLIERDSCYFCNR